MTSGRHYHHSRSRSPNASSPSSPLAATSSLNARASRHSRASRSPVMRPTVSPGLVPSLQESIYSPTDERGFPMDFFVEATKAQGAQGLRTIASMPSMVAPRDRSPAADAHHHRTDSNSRSHSPAATQNTKLPPSPSASAAIRSPSVARYQAAISRAASPSAVPNVHDAEEGLRWSLSASRLMIGAAPAAHADETTAGRHDRGRRSPSPMTTGMATEFHRRADDDVIRDAFSQSSLRGIWVNGGTSSVVV